MFRDVKFSNTIHLVHLVPKDTKIDLDQYGDNLIDFPGNIETNIPPELDDYELYFLIKASIYYYLEENPDDTTNNLTHNSEYKTKTHQEMVAEFISLYCTDETARIVYLRDEKALDTDFQKFIEELKGTEKFKNDIQNLPTKIQIKESVYDTERIQLAKILKINEHSHTILTELFESFKKLYDVEMSSSEFLNTLLDDVIKDKYHLLYIKNSKAESTFEDKKSNVKVVYGIKLEKDKFEDALRQKEEQAKQQSQMASQEEFLRFIKYMPSEYQTTYADSKIDFSDLYTEVDKHTEDTTHTKTAEHNETTNQPSSNFIY